MYRHWYQRNHQFWIFPDIFPAIVKAAFTFRLGGVSHPPFESLNMGLHVSDSPDHVVENRRLVAQRFGIPLEKFVFAEQVHGHRVEVVGAKDAGSGAFGQDTAVTGADALVTAEKDLALAILVADCVPVLLFDPISGVIAAVHSGWKGTAEQIVQCTLAVMQQHFATQAQQVYAVLGPSIRRCCYEVDERVRNAFSPTFPDTIFSPSQRPGHYMLSLQHAIRYSLLKYGVRAERIQDTGVCTACRTDVLFSYRAERGQTGRMLAAIAIQSAQSS
ncbi:peptidoglycan editing factor PgeF [Alicyclobacillus sp. TC]|nr:peptidoglycan editing factor PgeF [Alicyclobacillus sp. TC]